MSSQKLGIAADHAGKELKKMVVDYLRTASIDVTDYGVASDTEQSVDYPDYAVILADEVAKAKADLGILICGTGIGVSIAANKVPGVRAAVVWDEYSCRLSRQHNDANVLCLGARTLNYHRAVELVKLWLSTKFEGDRHQRRINKMREIEKRHAKC